MDVELWMSSFETYMMAGCRLRQLERFKRGAAQAGRSLGQASEAAVEEVKMRAKLFDDAQQRTEELRKRTSSYVDSMCAPFVGQWRKHTVHAPMHTLQRRRAV